MRKSERKRDHGEKMKERMKESVCERASEREGEREEKGGHTRRKSLGDRIDPDLTWTRSLATGA